LSNVLGKDGKLTDVEQQCRIEQNLCTYCGAAHCVEDCKKREIANKKAHACKAEASALRGLWFWLGYADTEDESSWLPATKLKHVAELVADFHSAYPGKPGSVDIFNSYVS
ncbi:hypothetical protein AN958_11331, partial [Leucoagaricus sp. SymC.cos]